jgi:hypothetical protein
MKTIFKLFAICILFPIYQCNTTQPPDSELSETDTTDINLLPDSSLISAILLKSTPFSDREVRSFLGSTHLRSNEIVSLDTAVTEQSPRSDIWTNIPTKRSHLKKEKMMVKIMDDKKSVGLAIPGFGGLKLAKGQKSFSVYFVEPRAVIVNNDTCIYGIGYSIHYLFIKVKRGLDFTQLNKIAASGQLESNKTNVKYSMQTYGIQSTWLAKAFKPEINLNFDVDGYAKMQTKIDEIHEVFSNDELFAKTNVEPEQLKFLSYKDLTE